MPTVHNSSVPQAGTSLSQKQGFESVGPIFWDVLDYSMHNLATADSFLEKKKQAIDWSGRTSENYRRSFTENLDLSKDRNTDDDDYYILWNG